MYRLLFLYTNGQTVLSTSPRAQYDDLKDASDQAGMFLGDPNYSNVKEIRILHEYAVSMRSRPPVETKLVDNHGKPMPDRAI